MPSFELPSNICTNVGIICFYSFFFLRLNGQNSLFMKIGSKRENIYNLLTQKHPGRFMVKVIDAIVRNLFIQWTIAGRR